MKVGVWLRTVLPILAIVGLIAGPFVTTMSVPMMAAASTMSEMPDGMPCCPPEKPAVPDCQKACTLTTTCMAKCYSITPLFSGMAYVHWEQSEVIRPGSDVAGAALALEPPARPPRT